MEIERFKIFLDHGKVDIGIIQKFEESIGLTFPVVYKDFISEHNGADLINDTFDFYDYQQNAIDTTSFYFLGFGSELGLIEYSEDVKNGQNYDVYGHEGLVTFGSNGCGDYICFDYRDCAILDQPKIIFMPHDENDGESDKMPTYFVAENFDEFCDLLYEDE